MADLYMNSGSRRPQPRRRSVGMALFDTLMSVITIVTAVLMVVTFLVPYINPGKIWFLPLLGLVAPAIYVATVLTALYWIIRWRWVFAGMMLVLVFLGLFDVSLFYHPELRRNYGEATYDRAAFKIMSYNVRSFYGGDRQSSADDVFRMIGEQDPDVVCLQEFNPRLAEASEQLALLDEKYESVMFGRTQAPDSVYRASLVIYSKYHILRSGQILAPRESVWADVLMGDDTVRIFNNHLRSTAIKATDGEFITQHRYLSDTARDVKIRSIVERLRDNSALRAAQVDSIAKVQAATRTRRIVCGDFNDTPMSYVYRTMADGLNDAFSEAGVGYSHTFRGLFNILRIDYVLSSDGFETLSYEVGDVDYSDHHPVIVRLKKTALKQQKN